MKCEKCFPLRVLLQFFAAAAKEMTLTPVPWSCECIQAGPQGDVIIAAR